VRSGFLGFGEMSVDEQTNAMLFGLVENCFQGTGL